MGNFIDMGFCKEDDPIFTEGITVLTIRKGELPSGSDEQPSNPQTPSEDELSRENLSNE